MEVRDNPEVAKSPEIAFLGLFACRTNVLMV